MIEELQGILSSYQPITLKEMDSVKLMDRTDTKYVFGHHHLPKILEQLRNTFQILQVEGIMLSRYETLYYDTPDFELYHKHQAKKSNRHKVRSRNYVESGINFLEVKLKNNKGRTIKTRIKISEIKEQLKACDQQTTFLQGHNGLASENFFPQFWVNYQRITLVSLALKVRCTIDLGLQFIKKDDIKDFSHVVILELKQERNSGSVVTDLMRSIGIREGGLSKYCLGVVSFNPTIKQNNFKPQLLYLNKIKNVVA